MNISEKLLNIQAELKAPKGQFNKFGKYKYRSCEDILEAVKPLCQKNKAVLTISDELVIIGDRYYIKSTAKITDIEKNESITNNAYAREEEEKKGMDGSQITGTASSYARKYALNGLFCIDDTKDADTNELKQQQDGKSEQEGNEMISKTKLDALNISITNNHISDEEVLQILQKYGYSSTSEIEIKNYMNIIKEFKAKVGG